MTSSSRNRDRSVMMSSVMPSAEPPGRLVAAKIGERQHGDRRLGRERRLAAARATRPPPPTTTSTSSRRGRQRPRGEPAVGRAGAGGHRARRADTR